MFGGVSMFNKEDFIKVNGFSNTFWGWGGEDDEIRLRCDREGLKVDRRPNRYTSLPHPKAKLNEVEYSENVKELNNIKINKDSKEYKTNGLNSLEYEILEIEHKKDYSLIKVTL